MHVHEMSKSRLDFRLPGCKILAFKITARIRVTVRPRAAAEITRLLCLVRMIHVTLKLECLANRAVRQARVNSDASRKGLRLGSTGRQEAG